MPLMAAVKAAFEPAETEIDLVWRDTCAPVAYNGQVPGREIRIRKGERCAPT